MGISIYIAVEFTSGNEAKALSAIHALDPRDISEDFTATGRGWWYKPSPNPRSRIARLLSRMGCTGRLTAESPARDARYDDPPPIRWTGFTARHNHTGTHGAMTCDVCNSED